MINCPNTSIKQPKTLELIKLSSIFGFKWEIMGAIQWIMFSPTFNFLHFSNSKHFWLDLAAHKQFCFKYIHTNINICDAYIHVIKIRVSQLERLNARVLYSQDQRNCYYTHIRPLLKKYKIAINIKTNNKKLVSGAL